MKKKIDTSISRNVIITYNVNGLPLVECMKNIIKNKRMLEKSE